MNFRRHFRSASVAVLLMLAASAAAVFAHDTWVQPNASLVRVGDVVHVDLMLGNHGNDHRDFKLVSKPSLDAIGVEVLAPDGSRHDLKAAMKDLGNAEKEGYFSARFRPAAPGLHLVAQTSDQVVSYAPTRSIKSGKTFFLAAERLDNPPADVTGFDRVLGHPLELVARSNPVAGAGSPLTVQLLYKGQPLADHRVSFIPRGVVLSEAFDSRYERKTDASGVASFTPEEGNYYLIVAHHKDDGAGEGYTSTKYSATIALHVAESRPR